MSKKLLILAAILALIFLVIVITIKPRSTYPNQTAITANNSVSSTELAIKNKPVVKTNDKNNNSASNTITTNSNIVRLDVMPSSPSAPIQEKIAVDEIPAQAIKLEVSNQGFKPQEFTLQAGKPVDLAITSLGGTHVFLFTNASLMALTTMVLDGETKLLSFTAPASGQYAFRDDLPEFRGNTGIMIVK